jgi:hypothetical protein
VAQPPGPGVPPDFHPPASYGGYGGDLQNYSPQNYSPQNSGSQATPPPAGSAPPIPAPALLTPRPQPAGPPQRPAGVGMAATLAATASLQWICALSLGWLIATAGTQQLGTAGVDGGVYHILNRFSDRLLDGLAWPLYLFPLASVVLSFLLLTRRLWARAAFTVTGVAALSWSAWWLRHDLLWWVIPAGYVATAVLVLWTHSCTRWYGWSTRSDPAGQVR